jgi:hypothetical protein
MLTAPDLLDFERAHPRHSGWKEEAIRREFGVTPARLCHLFGRAAESREGIEHDPFTARRIRERGRPAA